MAKQDDMEQMHKLQRRSAHYLREQYIKMMTDGGKLCPTCMKPLEEYGESRTFMGEKVCGKCCEAMIRGEKI